jgi:RimJ/RimL family protein N-acetyltransferase
MLEGNKVSIRPIEDFDLKTIYQWSRRNNESAFFLNDKNDIEINSYIQLEKDYWEKRTLSIIPPLPMVIEKANGTVIGFLRIAMNVGDNMNSFLGIAFLDKEHFFSEEGKEAGILILEYLFNKKNFFRVWTKVIEEERDCLGYLLRLGFKLEGVQKRQVFLKGRYLDLCELGVFRDEVEWRDTGHA